ncbi:patatin-like phospholipase family protein [uncultured Phenylobacterium sp.]|uniref:patatin-like phospholipase family protein n=1 Tax=uncultured Phenylobacterium sp. TaxID=349273 RepID=UPI0025F0A9D5|nr:patatin-like phospholipase family protein [uncultured Phenylobacterium sp.]
MADEIRKALVLQGGGALGAFALGAIRELYGARGWRPDLISGVSIGAITAVLLARPRDREPLEALEAFWAAVTVAAPWLPQPLRRYASAYGNPAFFIPRTDLWAAPGWTSLYDTAPLRRTLEGLVDVAALADPTRLPRLVVTATDIAAGQIISFDSADPGGLSLDHILASGSLPPSFPMTRIGTRDYWDGGLFDNTPLGDVLSRLSRGGDPSEREVIVVNLFPNAGPAPTSLGDVSQRVLNLTFANKTESDLKLLARFNAVSVLLDKIRGEPEWAALAASEAFKQADRDYVAVPRVLAITRASEAGNGAWTDFSPGGIEALALEGAAAARAEIDEPWMEAGVRRDAPH